MEPIVNVQNLHKRFGNLEVLKGVNLRVAPREVVCLIGRSGSGKSTLLRCINFLEEPNEGVISVAGISVPAGERTGQVVAEGEGQAHLRLVRRDRHPIRPRTSRGLVDQPALADPGLAVQDHGDRASFAVRPSHGGAHDVELVRAAEELSHGPHSTRVGTGAGSEGVPS